MQHFKPTVTDRQLLEAALSASAPATKPVVPPAPASSCQGTRQPCPPSTSQKSYRDHESLRARFAQRVRRQQPRYGSDTPGALRGRGNGHHNGPGRHSYAWGPAVQRDLQAVMHECGMPETTTAAVLAAAKRGDVSSNAGIILGQIVRLLDVVEPLLGTGGIAAVLRGCPSLLNHDPSTLATNFTAASHALAPAPLAPMLACAPALLAYPPFRIWTNLAALGDLLGIPATQAGSLVAKQPRLLLNSPAALADRLEALCALLPALPRKAVVALVVKAPGLLSYFPATLSAKLQGLAQLLGCEGKALAVVVSKQPALLTLDGEGLFRRLDRLSTTSGLPRQRLTALLMKQPTILALAPATVASKVAALGKLTGLHGPELAHMLEGVPALLTLQPATVASKWALLHECSQLHACWGEQLAAAPRRRVGLWLCFGERRLRRLQYVAGVVSAAKVEGVFWSSVLGASDVAFCERWPGYEAWARGGEGARGQRQQQQQQQQETLPSRSSNGTGRQGSAVKRRLAAGAQVLV